MNSLRLCLFCGSRYGESPLYADAVRTLCRLLANQGGTLITGGGHVGLMGVAADAMLAAGGHVIGVIPRALVERELAHSGLTQLHIVDSMHERKALMASHCDAFVAAPGGLGTYEEWFEVLTWRQLGFHDKPVALLNVNHYFDPLLALLKHAQTTGFLDTEPTAWSSAEDPVTLLAMLMAIRRGLSTDIG